MLRLVRAAVAIALAAAMVLAAGRLRAVRDRPYDVEVVPPAGAVRWLSLGHALLASHLYWLRTVQYIGEPRAEERGWAKLLPLVDLVTDLDPGHGYAYQVAGIVLASADRVQESNAILEKGTRNVRNRYVLPYYRAFNAFYHEHDWETAGRWAEIAARTPGAPPHVRDNVLSYYVKGDRVEAALDFLETARREAEDDETRKALDAQILQAKLEQVAGKLDLVVERWRERYLVGPVVLESLVAEGLLEEVPADPAGGTFFVDAEGRVRSTAHPRRLSRKPPPGLQAPPKPITPGLTPSTP